MSGSTQDIHLKVVDSQTSESLENFSCKITGNNGDIYFINQSPTTLKVQRGRGSLLIDCKKDGYKQLNIGVGSNFNALTIANVIFWPGLFIDAASGAYQSYPSHYVINMEKFN